MRSSSASGTAVAERAVPTPRLDPSVRVHPFRFDPSVTVDVPLVSWPRGDARRVELARRKAPCVLVIGADAPAPAQWTELEDWVRDAGSRDELLTRATTVARRADLRARPVLDRARGVTFRSRTVTVPEKHVALIAILVERFGDVIADDEILDLCGEHGVSTHAEAVKTTLRRVKDALAPLGLRLSRVRGAGYLLDRMA